MAGTEADNRRSLRQRLIRRRLFLMHLILYLVGGTFIWTLHAPELDKQFDLLFWLALLSAHGLVVFRRRRVAFLFHLIMFSAGNAAIWSTTAPDGDKLTVIFGWTVVAAIVGLWLYRRHALAKLAAQAKAQTPARKRRPKPPPPPPEAEPIPDELPDEIAEPLLSTDDIEETPAPRRSRRKKA